MIIYLSIYLFIYLSILSIYLFIYIFICIYIHIIYIDIQPLYRLCERDEVNICVQLPWAVSLHAMYSWCSD